MARDFLRYDEMVEAALRGVVREALERVAKHGLFGSHHFYLTFRSGAPGVELPDYLRERFPVEMTIVLEHQFWDLTVHSAGFEVTLSFQGKPERLVIPFAAVTAFADPSVKFHLQFQTAVAALPAVPEAPAAVPALLPEKKEQAENEKKSADKAAGDGREAKKPAEVVTLDAFRKK